MPWHADQNDTQSTASETADQGQSLTSILKTPENRTNLLILIADCTELLRKAVVDTFDPEKPNPRTPRLPPRPSESDAAEEKSAEEIRLEQKTELDREQNERERRIKELAAPKMLDLKVAALTYFDEWRDRVIGRMGEAVNQQPSFEKQKIGGATRSDITSKRIESSNQVQVDDLEALDQHAIRSLAELYPPCSTPLVALPRPKRVLILHSLLLLLLSLERYPSESRILLLQITTSLHLPLGILTTAESNVARGLLEAAQQQLSAEAETKKAQNSSTISRRWKVGLGAVAGAAIIGVTGGLAAPFLAAGIGTVFAGVGLGSTAVAASLGALAGSAPLIGVLFGAYGASMTGKVVDQFAKEVQDFKFLPTRNHRKGIFHQKSAATGDDKENRRLRVAIGVSGWLSSQEDVVKPWHIISMAGTEAFALRWELEALMNLGNALTTYMKSAAWSLAKKEIISRTILGALTAGLWPLGLAKMSRVIDNPFSVAKARSDKAGVVLADVLINKVQGERPVTLIGYSLGARLIYACLQSLADRHAFGLVENVVLLGAPAPSDSVNWRKVRSVVSGRVVNVYSTKDYLLGFLYRTSSLQYGIAGLQEVVGVIGVENVDVSELVDGHTKYRLLTGAILKQIGVEDVDLEEADRQAKEEEREEEREEEERRRRAENGEETAEEMQREVDKKNKEGMIGWMSDKMSSLRFGTGSARGTGEGSDKVASIDKP